MMPCLDASRKYTFSVIYGDSNVYIKKFIQIWSLYAFKPKSIKIYIYRIKAVFIFIGFHPEPILILKTLV